MGADVDRRALLNAGAMMGAVLMAGACATGQQQAAEASKPKRPLSGDTPGKPGDFDFLTGEWRIRNRQKPAPDKDWIEFDGEATVVSILGGVVSIEELRIPARNFSGMGLRVLDIENRIWSDYWINARSGVLGAEGVTGSFENGDAVFISEEMDGATRVLYRGLWDGITPTSCRWSQAASRDGGKTWEDNWVMEWTRV